MNRRVLTSLVGMAALLIAVGCNQTATPTAPGGKPRIAEPTTCVTFSEDFNPYDNNSVASSMGTRSMVNEPLVEFDQLDATAAGTHPWLATAYAFQNGGKDLQVTIRQNVKFSDGSGFGPADVAATFKMLENPKTNTRGVPPQASDPTVNGNNVTLHFSSAQYTGLFNILSHTFMLKAATAAPPESTTRRSARRSATASTATLLPSWASRGTSSPRARRARSSFLTRTPSFPLTAP